MHEDEEGDYPSVVVLFSVGIAVAYGGIAAFCEYLHHEVLRVDEGFEVGVLIEDVIAGVVIDEWFCLVEDFHAEDAEDEEDEGEEVEEFDDDGHDLKKSGEDAFYVVYDRVV